MSKGNSYWNDKSKIVENYGSIQEAKSFTSFGKFLFWRNKIKVSNEQKTVKKFNWFITIFVLIAIMLFIFAISMISPKTSPYGSTVFLKKLNELFSFTPKTKGNVLYTGENIWTRSLTEMLVTIKITVIGTLIGLILAIPTSFLSARNITTVVWINWPVRMVMAIFRTLPPLTFAMIFAAGFTPTFAATLTLIFFTWAVMNKLLYEEIENTSLDSYNALITAGIKKRVAFRQTVFKSIAPKIVSLGLYSFEINLRISAILGVIGGLGGIGSMIQNLRSQHFENLGIPLVVIFSSVILLELTSTLIRILLFEIRARKFDSEALDSYTSEREYYIAFEENKAASKIEKLRLKISTKNENKINNKINKISEKKKTKIFKIKNKYDKADNNQVILSFKTTTVDIKEKYKIKNEKLNKIYNAKINKTKSPSKKRKYEIVLKQNQLQNEIDLEKELDLLNSSMNSNNRTIFVYKKHPKHYLIKLFLFAILISLVIYSSVGMEWSTKQGSKLSVSLGYVFKPNFSYFGTTVPAVWNAMLVAFAATMFGGIIAFTVGMLASRNVLPWYLNWIFKFLIILIRVIPAFVIVILILPMFMANQGSGFFIAFIALSIHSVGMLGKLVKEQFDNIDIGPALSIRTAGGNQFEVIKYGVFPQVMPKILSVIIYRFEINLKSIVEVSVFASFLPKMGWLMNQHFNTAQNPGEESTFGKAYAFVWTIVIFILIIEFFSNMIRSFLLTGELPSWIKKIQYMLYKRINIKRAIYLKNIGLEIQNRSDMDIALTYDIERQAAYDRGVLKLIKDNKNYLTIVNANMQIFELTVSNINSSKDEIKNNNLKIKELIKEKRIAKKRIKMFLKTQETKNKDFLNKYSKKAKKEKQIVNKLYKEVLEKYKYSIRTTKTKYKENLLDIKKQYKLSKNKDEFERVVAKKQYIKAKKQYSFNIKNARKQKLFNFV